MAFFYNEVKSEAPKKSKPKVQRGAIPIASLRTLGCSVCSHDKAELKSPKMRPSGPKEARVYLLGTSPSSEDDELDQHWSDPAGEHIFSKFGAAFMKEEVRSNYVTQCRGEQTQVEVECCRNRIVADIEQIKPLIIVTVGDAPLQWIMNDMERISALNHRGTQFVTKIGNHVCWVLPILYPNYIHKKKRFGKSEYELCVEHDVKLVKYLVNHDDFATQIPKVYEAPYDTGIDIITGQEPGDLQRLEKALARIAMQPEVGLDIETNGLRPNRLKDPLLLTIAIGTFDYVVAFPVDHPDGWGSKSRRDRVWSLLGDFLLASGHKIAHHLGMELQWLNYFFGAKVLRETDWHDTMAMTHTVDERQGNKSLAVQTRLHFGFDLKAQSRVDVKQPEWWLKFPLKDILRYNGMDSKWTHLLFLHHRATLQTTPAYWAEYERKVRLAPTLTLCEAKGVPVSQDVAKAKLKALAAQVIDLESKISRTPEVKEYRNRFGVFSPTNSDQVLKLMRDVCKRPEVRVEERGGAVRWTTEEEALAQIPASEVPSAALILEHRGVSKPASTYVQPVLDGKIIDQDGRIRCTYSSMVAVTGRLASDDPNLQNWPKRKHRHIRGIIKTPGIFLACDYGQIEFRVVGMASEDRNLVKACWTNYDVHKFWAERMVAMYPAIKDYIVEAFQVDWDEKGLKTLRQEAKNGWVFPQLFGSSIRSCAEQLHLPEHVAEDLGAEFWDEFSGVKKWQEKLLKSYERNLYVETLGGRRRRGAMTKNEIINMPIQGTAADIVLEGMCAISELSYAMSNDEIQPELNVHDDLTFEMDPDHLDDNLVQIIPEMCKPRFSYINVPLVVEASTGTSWDELHEIGVYRSNDIFNTPNPYA